MTNKEEIFLYVSIWIAIAIVTYLIYVIAKHIILFILNTHFSVFIFLFFVGFMMFWDEKVKREIYNKSKTKIKELLNSQK